MDSPPSRLLILLENVFIMNCAKGPSRYTSLVAKGSYSTTCQSDMTMVRQINQCPTHEQLFGITAPGKAWEPTSAGPASALAARVACRLRAVAAFCCTYGALPEKHAILNVREQAKWASRHGVPTAWQCIIWQLFTPAVRTFQAFVTAEQRGDNALSTYDQL